MSAVMEAACGDPTGCSTSSRRCVRAPARCAAERLGRDRVGDAARDRARATAPRSRRALRPLASGAFPRSSRELVAAARPRVHRRRPLGGRLRARLGLLAWVRHRRWPRRAPRRTRRSFRGAWPARPDGCSRAPAARLPRPGLGDRRRAGPHSRSPPPRLRRWSSRPLDQSKRGKTAKHLTLRQALWYVRDDMMSSIVKGQSARVVGKSDGVRREGFGAGEPLMGALGAPRQPGCNVRGRSELRARPTGRKRWIARTRMT